MSLYLYDKTDTSFNNEGLGVLLDFVTDPEVTENINGFFELTFTYALGGHLAEHLNEEMYISSKTNEHDDEYLVFRIYESEPDYVDGSVIVRARLKQTDDFMNSIVKARTLLKGDIGFQLRTMMSNSTPTLNYRVGGTVNGVLDIEREDDNIFNMLFDDNGLFTLNGITPKFTPEGITITKDRAWSTASIITEKNFIEQLTINTSRRDMVTQIIPFTETRRDVLTPNEDSKYHKRETIEEKVYGTPVISPKVARMGYPVITRFMEFRNDVKEELKMDETEYNTYLYESVDDLNEKVKTFFTDNEGIDEYEVEVSIETLGLHMDDYEQISSLGLYDIVEIYLEEYGVNVPVQVMEVTYSPLVGRNTQLKLTSKFNRIEHASNRINSNAPSEQELREFIQNQIINNKINETVHNFIIKDDGTKISYVNQLPPVESAIEGDVVFLVTEEGGSIWEFVNGAWVEVLPLNFKQYVTDQLTEVFNQFDTERTETEQSINEALGSAIAEAERLDEERQLVIDGKFEVVNKTNEKLEQSIATAEQNAQDALTKAGASEDLAKTAKQASESALANIGTVSTELGEVKTQASDSLTKAQEALNATGTLSTQVQSFEETVDGYKTEVANYSLTNETLTAKVNSYEKTVDGYSQTLTRVEGKVDNLQIGGENLLIDSEKIKDLGPEKIIDNQKFYDIPPNNWTNVYTIDLIAGETYTVSVPVYNSTDKPLSSYVYINVVRYLKQVQPGEIIKHKVTIRPTKTALNTKLYILTYSTGDNLSLSFGKAKLEKGNVATDWSRAIEDEVSKTEFITYQNEVKSTTDEHTRRLTALDGDEGRISKVEQTATQIQRSLSDYARTGYVDTKITEKAGEITTNLTRIEGKIDNLQIGGTNLLIGSEKVEELGTERKVGNQAFYDIPYNEWDNFYQVNLEKGVTYTLSVPVYNNNNEDLSSYISTTFNIRDDSVVHAKSTGKHILTFTPKETVVDGKIYILTQNNTNNLSLSFGKAKLEKGNIATDWSSAEEDKVSKTEFQTVKETTNLYERTIGTTEANIKSNIAKITMTDSLFQQEITNLSNSGGNIIPNSGYISDLTDWRTNVQGALSLGKHPFYNNGSDNLLLLTTNVIGKEVTASSPRFRIKPNTEYTFSFKVFANIKVSDVDVHILGRKFGETADYATSRALLVNIKPSPSKCDYFSVTFTTSPDMEEAFIRIDNDGSNDGSTATVYFTELSLVEGKYPKQWQPAPKDVYDVSSKVTQLSNSWALTLKSGNDIKTAINATTDGIRLKGSLITLDGQVNMTDSFIVPEGNIGNLSAKKITSGTIDTARLNSLDIVTKGLTSNVVKSEHILANEALFTKLFTNDLATQKLATKQAWIKSSMIGEAQIGTAQIGQIDASNGRIVNLDASSITSGTMTANRISGGVLNSTNGATSFDLNTGQLSFLQQGVAIKSQFSGRPLQYLGFYSGTYAGSQGSYTALMSNSGNIAAMDKNSAGIQIWNNFDKKTAITLYGNVITFKRNADVNVTNQIDIDTVNNAIKHVNTINNLRIVPMSLSGTSGVALMYGNDAGLWIGGYGDFAFKHDGVWIGKARLIN